MAIAWDAYERATRAMAEFKSVPVVGKAEWMQRNPELAAEWARQNGLKEKLAEFRRRQVEKRARISG